MLNGGASVYPLTLKFLVYMLSSHGFWLFGLIILAHIAIFAPRLPRVYVSSPVNDNTELLIPRLSVISLCRGEELWGESWFSICVPRPIRLSHATALLSSSRLSPHQKFDYHIVVFNRGEALLLPETAPLNSTSNISLAFFGQGQRISSVPWVACSGSLASPELCKHLVQDFLYQKRGELSAHSLYLLSPARMHLVLNSENATDPASLKLLHYYARFLHFVFSDESVDIRSRITPQLVGWERIWPSSIKSIASIFVEDLGFKNDELDTVKLRSVVFTLYNSQTRQAADLGNSGGNYEKHHNISRLLTDDGSIIVLPGDLISRRDALVQHLWRHLGFVEHLAGVHTLAARGDYEAFHYTTTALPPCWSLLLRRWASVPFLGSQTNHRLTKFKVFLDGTILGSVIRAALQAVSDWVLSTSSQGMVFAPNASLWTARMAAVFLHVSSFITVSTHFVLAQLAQQLSFNMLFHHPSLLPQPLSIVQMLTAYCPFSMPLLIPLLRGMTRQKIIQHS